MGNLIHSSRKSFILKFLSKHARSWDIPRPCLLAACLYTIFALLLDNRYSSVTTLGLYWQLQAPDESFDFANSQETLLYFFF